MPSYYLLAMDRKPTLHHGPLTHREKIKTKDNYLELDIFEMNFANF